MQPERHLTAAELAERLGMGKGSIYKLAKMRKIPSYATGPKLTGLRFNFEEVRAALRRPAAVEGVARDD